MIFGALSVLLFLANMRKKPWLKAWAGLGPGPSLLRGMQKSTDMLLPAGTDFSGIQINKKWLGLSGWWHLVSTEKLIWKDKLFFVVFFLNSEKVHLNLYVHLEWKNRRLACVLTSMARRNSQPAWGSPGTFAASTHREQIVWSQIDITREKLHSSSSGPLLCS